MLTQTCKCCGQEKPLNEFYKNRIGYTNVCKECVMSKRKESKERKSELSQLRQQVNEKRQLALSDFSPCELMKELKRRGYEFTITYTEIHTIKSDSLYVETN